MPLLLYTKLGIEKVLEFLGETRILTRRWYIEQAECHVQCASRGGV